MYLLITVRKNGFNFHVVYVEVLLAGHFRIMRTRIHESVQVLTQCVNQIGRNQSVNMTPVRQGSHSHDNDAAELFCPQVISTSHTNRQSLRLQDTPTYQRCSLGTWSKGLTLRAWTYIRIQTYKKTHYLRIPGNHKV